MIRKITLSVLSMLMGMFMYAQVTTSSFTGTVSDASGNKLQGATITVIHQPSGTVYHAIAGKDGSFTIPSVRVGGPYQVQVNFVGLTAYKASGLTTQLGEPFYLNPVLSVNNNVLDNVVVSAKGRTDKVGTNIGTRQIQNMPTISRSISDFTRLTPQANGNSFAGRDNRYNNMRIDGANLNNNFGLSSDPMPGGGSNPVSLDAIEEVNVSIAPVDVRQSGFTGAGINAVTRSGDNTYRGSVYGYYRDQSYNGTHVGPVKLAAQQQSTNKIYGFRVGGPIIKNKLFFFVNAEKETRTYPGVPYRPSQPGLSGSTVSATSIDSLRKLSDYLKSKYGYDAGAYDNFPGFQAENTKVLARVDWNISDKHKLTVKYSDFQNTNDVQVNGTSVPGGGYGAITRLGNNRFSSNSMAFANSNYGFKDVVQSGTVELNSRLSNKFHNQLLGAYTHVQDTRTFKGGLFPTIDFLNLSSTAALNNLNYMSVGMDPFTNNNDVINNTLSVTDNVTYFAGRHTLTAGGSYEYQRVGNMFMPASNSYYIYRSMNDFMTDKAPAYYALTYSLVPNSPAVYSAELKMGQLGFYAQDEIKVSKKLQVTVGVRADKPEYASQPLANPALASVKFLDVNGDTTHYSTGAWPTATWYWSPRAGFRWDAKGDKSLIVRGGSGIFTGRIPFVFLTNIPTNSAMYQVTAAVTSSTDLVNYKFNPNPNAYLSRFPTTAGASIVNNSNFVFTNPNFKFPQVWRSNLSVEKALGKGFTVNLEGLYTKDINAVYMRNANLKATDSVFVGADNRPRYRSTAKLNSNIASAIVLENTNKGQSYSVTAQVSKQFTNGFYGSLAYTYTNAQDVTGNPGSQASSVWNSNPNKSTANEVVLAHSQYEAPHRIVGVLSYRREYVNHLATTVSLFYEAEQTRYSYTYSSDINGDGNGFDLFYVPRSATEVNLVTTTIGGQTYTPQQQWALLNNYIEQDKYLRQHRGQVTDRNGALTPFYHRIDGKFLQDIFTNIGGQKNSLQFSVDVLNLANLVNRNWGVYRQVIQKNVLVPKGVVNGQQTYTINSANNVPVTSTFQDVQTTSSTWGIQLGLRYSF